VSLSGVTCSAPFSIPTSTVTINDSYQFVPDTLTIDRRTYVEWKNESTQYHLVQGDTTNPGGLQEISLAPVGGETSEYPQTEGELQMNQPGVYPYHCTVHTQMHGVLIVR
jgi:plastocyanin